MRYMHGPSERIWTFQDKMKFDGDQWLLLFGSPTADGGLTYEWLSVEDLAERDVWHPMP